MATSSAVILALPQYLDEERLGINAFLEEERPSASTVIHVHRRGNPIGSENYLPPESALKFTTAPFAVISESGSTIQFAPAPSAASRRAPMIYSLRFLSAISRFRECVNILIDYSSINPKTAAQQSRQDIAGYIWTPSNDLKPIKEPVTAIQRAVNVIVRHLIQARLRLLFLQLLRTLFPFADSGKRLYRNSSICCIICNQARQYSTPTSLNYFIIHSFNLNS